MKSLSLFLLLIPALALAKLTPPKYETVACREIHFATEVWKDLMDQQPALRDHMILMGQYIPVNEHGKVRMRNCEVAVPVNSRGQYIAGERIVTMDAVKETTVNGEKATYHFGMRIVYKDNLGSSSRTVAQHVGCDIYGNPVVQYTNCPTGNRQIEGFMVCGGGTSCEALGIPLKGGATSAMGDPPDLVISE